jgi:hypothetical protein
MLEVEGDIIEFDLIGIQVGAYQQGVLAQLLGLQIMHPKYSWSQKIMKGLGWLIDHLSTRCGQELLGEEKRILELIERELFAPYDWRVAKAQHTEASAKNRFNQRLLEDFAPVAVVKRIVYEAMLDLGALGVVTKGKSDLTPSERHAGTTSFIMALYGNGFAGRTMIGRSSLQALPDVSCRRDATTSSASSTRLLVTTVKSERGSSQARSKQRWNIVAYQGTNQTVCWRRIARGPKRPLLPR